MWGFTVELSRFMFAFITPCFLKGNSSDLASYLYKIRRAVAAFVKKYMLILKLMPATRFKTVWDRHVYHCVASPLLLTSVWEVRRPIALVYCVISAAQQVFLLPNTPNVINK